MKISIDQIAAKLIKLKSYPITFYGKIVKNNRIGNNIWQANYKQLLGMKSSWLNIVTASNQISESHGKIFLRSQAKSHDRR